MTTKQTSILVVRHAERLDYTLRDESKLNWIASNIKSQPWNTPITEHGCQQSFKLGKSLIALLDQHDLPPVTAVYSSPLLRCVQTASKLINGLQSELIKEGTKTINNGDEVVQDLSVRIEQGLIETMKENWYRSWCLPGSDSTWGYRMVARSETEPEISMGQIHPMARIPIQSLLGRMEISLLQEIQGQEKQASSSSSASPPLSSPLPGNCEKQYKQELNPFPLRLDKNYHSFHASIHQISTPYQWGHFESQTQQIQRVQNVVNELAKRHLGETIVLVSHGGPVTHLYESMMNGNPFYDKDVRHGTSKYTCCSLYTKSGGQETTNVWRNLLLNDTSHLRDSDELS